MENNTFKFEGPRSVKQNSLLSESCLSEAEVRGGVSSFRQVLFGFFLERQKETRENESRNLIITDMQAFIFLLYKRQRKKNLFH